jgi:hypothetical protein
VLQGPPGKLPRKVGRARSQESRKEFFAHANVRRSRRRTVHRSKCIGEGGACPDAWSQLYPQRVR